MHSIRFLLAFAISVSIVASASGAGNPGATIILNGTRTLRASDPTCGSTSPVTESVSEAWEVHFNYAGLEIKQDPATAGAWLPASNAFSFTPDFKPDGEGFDKGQTSGTITISGHLSAGGIVKTTISGTWGWTGTHEGRPVRTTITELHTLTWNVNNGAATAHIEVSDQWIETFAGGCTGTVTTVRGADWTGNVGAFPTCSVRASVPSLTQSDVAYDVTWTAGPSPNSSYTIDESTDPSFSSNVASQNVAGLSATFRHAVSVPTPYYYRVRINDCGSGSPGPNSPTVAITIEPTPVVTGRSGEAAVPFGSTSPVQLKVFVPRPAGANDIAGEVPFAASTDRSYLSVAPSSGVIPPSGLTLTVTGDPRNLPPGANTGTLRVTSSGVPVTSKALSVTLVTPVAPGGKGVPTPNTLIIPAVAHAPGAFGPFQSDIRLMNGTLGRLGYLITFTPTRTDATTGGKVTTVTVEAGETIALNDILKNFFGIGATSDPRDAGQGALEIRPLETASLANYAASRTFTFNDRGTFGQFIAAIRYAAFASRRTQPGSPAAEERPVLTMLQVAQSPKFRTNLGIVEGAGNGATGTIRVFDAVGTLLSATPYELRPGEHQQTALPALGVPSLEDGRIDVTVESEDGAVTAYASVIDNVTNDPFAVMPVQVSKVNATRYVLPGMAALGGPNNFHSDVRIFNGGPTSASVTATFYPQGNGEPRLAGEAITIGSGQVRRLDDVVSTLFNSDGTGGSIVLRTASPSSLVTSGRTYTISATGGTFGQFIPGVTSSEGTGRDERPLQILQLEESPNFRSNVGIAEIAGEAVTVRVTAYAADSKLTPSIELDLGPHRFVQLSRVLAGFYPDETLYNARISVEVVGGRGRVTAYGSVVDNASLDPTYVPAQ